MWKNDFELENLVADTHTVVVNLNTSLKPIRKVNLILENGPRVRNQTGKFLWTRNVKRQLLTECSLYILRNKSESMICTTVIFYLVYLLCDSSRH